MIIHDARTNFNSSEFRQQALLLAINIKQVPVKATYSIRKVERYHVLLLRVYKIIIDELQGQHSTKEIRL